MVAEAAFEIILPVFFHDYSKRCASGRPVEFSFSSEAVASRLPSAADQELSANLRCHVTTTGVFAADRITAVISCAP